LEFLDDVDRNSAKTDGYVLSYQASTGKFIGTEVSSGSASQWVSTTAGIHTLSNVGIGTTNPTEALFVVGNAVFTGNVSVAGTVTYDDVTNVDSIGLLLQDKM
jgi:ethanolamine utilization microcompartment shell protein EutL